ncbi:hypothetical protein GCM10009815_01460 [Nocardioides marmoribigeumensis]
MSVKGSGSDNVALSSVSVSVDGGAWSTASGTSSWSWSWNTASLSDGSHTVAARAVDTSGNASTSSVTVNVSNTSVASADTTAPTVAFSAPAAGSTVSGSVAVKGGAADDSMLAKVEVRVDSGTWQVASGTSSWSWTWPTGSYADGGHTLFVRATDGAGNVSSTGTRSVTVSNTSADTTGPALAITTPSNGSTITGTVSVQGTVSDPSGVSKLEVSVDGRAWQNVIVRSSWSWAWVTGRLSNGAHTLRARAIDATGNASITSLQVNVDNPCLSGGPVLSQSVTAEGVVIRICTTTGGWTTSAIESLLRDNARDLVAVGPDLVLEIQTAIPTSEATGVGSEGPNSVVYLNSGSSSSFQSLPQALMAHEYGHAWTNHWFYANPADGRSWDGYLAARGLTGDPRIDSSYNWTTGEMAADDYRRLFGSPLAQSQMKYLNSDVPDSQAVAGLADFFTNQFAMP